MRAILAVAAPIWLLFWLVVLNASGPFDLSGNDFMANAAAKLGLLTFPPGLLITKFCSVIPSLGPSVLAFLAQRMGGDLNTAALLMDSSAIILGMVGPALVAWRLSGSPVPVFLLALLYPVGWLTFLIVGYPGVSWSISAPAGLWAQGWAIFVWSLWFVFPVRGPWGLIPFFLAGVLIDFHATYGIILAAIFFGEIAYRFLFQPREKFRILQIGLLKVAILVIAAAPFFLALGPSLYATSSRHFDADLWWRLMAFRKPFHVFLWNERDVQNAFEQFSIFFLLWANVRPLLEKIEVSKLHATAWMVAAFCLVSYVALVLVPTPRLVGLVLSRSGFICSTPA